MVAVLPEKFRSAALLVAARFSILNLHISTSLDLFPDSSESTTIFSCTRATNDNMMMDGVILRHSICSFPKPRKSWGNRACAKCVPGSVLCPRKSLGTRLYLILLHATAQPICRHTAKIIVYMYVVYMYYMYKGWTHDVTVLYKHRYMYTHWHLPVSSKSQESIVHN